MPAAPDHNRVPVRFDDLARPDRTRLGRSRRVLIVLAAAGLASILAIGSSWHPSAAVAARNNVNIYVGGQAA